MVQDSFVWTKMIQNILQEKNRGRNGGNHKRVQHFQFDNF